jgi:hypothetical protein
MKYFFHINSYCNQWTSQWQMEYYSEVVLKLLADDSAAQRATRLGDMRQAVRRSQ